MERWQEVEEIFHEALQREPAERDAYVRQACRDDSALRREVVSLLENHTAAQPSESWMAAAAAQLVSSPGSLQPGHSLGLIFMSRGGQLWP